MKFQSKMAGTEGTHEYDGNVVAQTSRGRVAFRDLHNGTIRVRVEPSAKSASAMGEILTRAAGWKQPGDGGQHRFSTVVLKAGLQDALTMAKRALGVGFGLQILQSPAANKRAKLLVEASV